MSLNQAVIEGALNHDIASEEEHTKSAVRPRSRRGRLLLARLTWLLIALPTLGLFAASLPARFDQLNHPAPPVYNGLVQASIAIDSFALYNLVLEVVFAASFLLVALLIFYRKSSDLTALFFSLMLVMVGTASVPILPTMEALSSTQPTLLPMVRFATFLTWAAVFTFFCIFPDGKPAPRWSLWFLAFAILVSIPWNLFPDFAISPWSWPAPVFVPFELGIWGTCILMQIYRYMHVSNPVQRQQTKWVVFGMAVSVIGVVGFYLPRAVNPAFARPADATTLYFYILSSTVICISALFTPVAMGISILRYKLWAIDIIISRTLVYVPLTGILAGVYTASIALFQRVFMSLTGDKSDIAIVVSTLILASLFTPIKNGLQSVVDRRFKEAPDPTKRLDELQQQVESVVDIFDPKIISHRLLDDAIAAFDADGGAVYLARRRMRGQRRSNNDLKLIYASDKWDGDACLSMPLKREGVLRGMLVLGPKRSGQDYTQEDREKLREIVGVVAKAFGLPVTAM